MSALKGVSNKNIAVVLLTAIAAFVVLTVTLIYFFRDAPFVAPSLTSAALVIVTAVLVYFTYGYSVAASNLVKATLSQVDASLQQIETLQEQVAATNQQAKATSAQVEVQLKQVEATKEQVAALTNPILYLDINLIERPVQNLVGVSVPEAFEVFIQNVGPGNACNISLEVEEDLIYVQGQGIRRLNEEIKKSNITRLAPGQRRTLAIIILSENLTAERAHGAKTHLRSEFAQHEVNVKYESMNEIEFNDSFLLDFTSYFELIKRLLVIPHTTSSSSDRSELLNAIKGLKPEKIPPYATYTLNLTKREKDYLRLIYNNVNGSITQPIMGGTLSNIARERGFTEREMNDYAMLFRDSGLVEVEILYGGGIAMLNLTAYAVHFLRGLKNDNTN